MKPGAVLITGAGQRIGKALALALGEDGWAVAVHYRRSEAAAQEVRDAIVAAGGTAQIIQADLADPEALNALIPAAARAVGPLHALINNASHFEDDRLQGLSAQSWDTHMDANLRAPVFLTRSFAAQVPDGVQGAVVNLGDQRVHRSNPRFFSYTLTKAALAAATRTMAQALAPQVRVNMVAPGPTLRNARQSEQDFEAQVRATLLGTGSPVDEIVGAVRYMLAARAVTGQTLIVDGGQHLLWRTADVHGVAE